jgi:hypothetical protein
VRDPVKVGDRTIRPGRVLVLLQQKDPELSRAPRQKQP